MGTRCDYSCDACGYRARVSGGMDRGLMAFVETMQCKKCKQLSDVIFAEVASDGEATFITPCCAECGSTKLTPWSEPHLCPKCGEQMTSGGVLRMWD